LYFPPFLQFFFPPPPTSLLTHQSKRKPLDLDVVDTTDLQNNMHAVRHSAFNINRVILEVIQTFYVGISFGFLLDFFWISFGFLLDFFWISFGFLLDFFWIFICLNFVFDGIIFLGYERTDRTETKSHSPILSTSEETVEFLCVYDNTVYGGWECGVMGAIVV
jgi:hypothetical protein